MNRSILHTKDSAPNPEVSCHTNAAQPLVPRIILAVLERFEDLRAQNAEAGRKVAKEYWGQTTLRPYQPLPVTLFFRERLQPKHTMREKGTMDNVLNPDPELIFASLQTTILGKTSARQQEYAMPDSIRHAKGANPRTSFRLAIALLNLGLAVDRLEKADQALKDNIVVQI